jgi:hypothetical protein
MDMEKDKKVETWMELCELAAREQDPEKLIALTSEIIRLLDEKRSIQVLPPAHEHRSTL